MEVYLLSAPRQRFRGKVQGIGWAVQPEGEVDLKGVPYVKRELNWVHIAQRFPVRMTCVGFQVGGQVRKELFDPASEFCNAP